MTTAVLKNPKHEMFARARFNGMSETEAYAAVGYAPHRCNASRTSANENILSSIAELHRAKADKTIHYATLDVLEEMHKLRTLVAEAAEATEAKDYTNAIKRESYILRLFGFEYSPTLAHAGIAQGQASAGTPALTPAPSNSNALSGALEQLKERGLRPYVLGVKAAHPRRKLRSGVASEWPKPSPKLSEDEPWISIADFSSVWTSRN